jgi:signal transduction histidine kinase
VTRRARSGTIAFRPRARLLKLIGEELISDEVVAVSELVKNAHDADASTVTLSFRGVGSTDGVIEVRDDGCGMDADTLLGRWMEPAASSKTAADRKMTARGRRVLGEKGVGRFAADKLARHLEVVSRCKGSPDEVRAVIDWDMFDDGERMLGDVKSTWEVQTAGRARGHGTSLRMTGLRTRWTERMFRRLSIRLGRLLSPFGAGDKFTVRIESDEFPDYTGDLRQDIVTKAPYRIEAAFDGGQTITFSTGRTRKVERRWNGHGELSCGPVRIRLHAFDLEGEALARIGPRTEVRAWLKEWTGVSVYRDGFRVWPYGEPHDDWLRLDQRRVNNPVEHLSNNQVIGFIDISRDRNPELLDQTNREGLIHNKALEDLRRLVYFVLQVLEAERQSIRHPVKRTPGSANGASRTDGDGIAGELRRHAEGAGGSLARELRQLADRLEEERAQERARGERLLGGYEGLAAIGQMAAVILPALPQEIGQVREELRAIRKATVAANGDGQHFARLADTLKGLADRLELFRLAQGGNDRRRAIDLAAELGLFERTVGPLLAGHGVRMEIEAPARQVVRTEMRPEHFHCLLQVLTANSLDWIGQGDGGDRRIRVVLAADGDLCEVVFTDSGPGIPEQLCVRVFEPGFTLKEGGRGMGLTIARRIVESHGGHMHVIIDGRRRGANLRISLPRKRSRATFQTSL